MNFYTYAGVLNLFQSVTYRLSEGLLASRSRWQRIGEHGEDPLHFLLHEFGVVVHAKRVEVPQRQLLQHRHRARFEAGQWGLDLSLGSFRPTTSFWCGKQG